MLFHATLILGHPLCTHYVGVEIFDLRELLSYALVSNMTQPMNTSCTCFLCYVDYLLTRYNKNLQTFVYSNDSFNGTRESCRQKMLPVPKVIS